MRGFIILCFSALAVAAPQGYNYPQVQASASQQLGYGQSIQPTLAAPLPQQQLQQQLQLQQQQQQQQQQLSVQSQYLAPQQISASHAEASINQQQQQQQFIPQMLILSQPQQSAPISLPSFTVGHQVAPQAPKQEVLISKRFFIHSAPEEEEEEYKEKVLTVGTPRKNYNVVFIRAPAKSNKKASIKITPALNEEKTVIYVLSKKTDATDIDAQIQEVATTTTKPEVYFIKYKTPEEAAHAQEKIQAEYDSLGGSTQVSNEGIAPVSSVIGALEEKLRQQQQQQQQLVEQQQSLAASAASAANSQVQEVLPSASGPTIASAILNTSSGYLPPNYYY